MRLSSRILLGSLLLLAGFGCGDDDTPGDAGTDSSAMADSDLDSDLDSGRDSGSDVMADADDAGDDAGDMGTPSLCPTDTVVLDAVEGMPAMAVMNSDFTSSAISLLAADGSILAESWFDSGSAAPGLTAALSGDAVLASSHPDGTLSVVDRFGSDVLTRFCIGSGSLVGQLRVGADGFTSNPQDMIVVGDRGFVSRYEQNMDSEAAAADQGSDLVGFDASTMERNGERVSFAEFGGTVMGLQEGEEVEVTTLPRPTSIVQVGEFLVVALERLPADLFGMARGAGGGMVAVVSLSDLRVEGWELSDLSNCGQVVPVAGSTDEVLVGCKGYSNIGFGDPNERETAGVIRLQIDGSGNATEVDAWRASESAEAPLAVNRIISLGGADFAGVATGEFGGAGDSLVSVVDGSESVIATSASGFGFGQGVLQDDVLLIPDSSATPAGVVRLQLVDEDAPVVLEPLEITSALPPQSIVLL